MATGAELTYNTNPTALQMANAIMGDGVTVTGATYTGDTRSRALYSNGDALAPGVVPSDSGVILSTGRATDFTQSNGDPNRSSSTSYDSSGQNNNAQFNAIAGASTFDASYLDISFIPTGSVMTIRFVFSSEEYPEYSASQYNDMVGVWINGTNVPITFGSGDVGVSDINQNENSNLFVNNTGDQFNTEMDGFTVALSLTIPVIPGVVNSIRIGIADVSDAQYDSNLLIAADSVQTRLVAIDDALSIYANGERTLNVLGNDVNATGGTLTITHINGIAVVAGQSVVLPSGDVIRLNADGTLSVLTDSDADTFNFTYTVKSSTGLTDIAIVNVDTIPCFVAGTMILTPEGERRVETLVPGDMVMTRDDGPRPLRWIGRRVVRARDGFAPVRIEQNTFGRHRTILVSPQHRVLVSGSRAELYFGEAEVLVAAKHLVDGRRVTVCEGGWVEYVHLLFDKHEIVWSDGLLTESFLPGPQTANAFERGVQDEILALFPELDPLTGEGYSPAARPVLRAYEAQLLGANL